MSQLEGPGLLGAVIARVGRCRNKWTLLIVLITVAMGACMSSRRRAPLCSMSPGTRSSRCRCRIASGFKRNHRQANGGSVHRCLPRRNQAE